MIPPVIHTAVGPLYLRGAMLKMYNVERVRSYMEKHLGCSNKEISRALDMRRQTVAKAVKTIRGQQ